jgi:hypothetical protein
MYGYTYAKRRARDVRRIEEHKGHAESTGIQIRAPDL